MSSARHRTETMLAKLLRSRSRAPRPTIPAGQRIYAVGDVHGRLDLLDELVAAIETDDAAREPAETVIIFLGDLIDRGPDSAGVVARLRTLAQRRAIRLLQGNHEEIFLATLEGDAKAARLFCRVGGRETALSYGVGEDEYEQADFPELIEMLDARVPEADRAFLQAGEDLIVIGDYAFAHAGVDPDLAFSEQPSATLRWIRDRFLKHRGTLEKVVVHGHTVADVVEREPHRIGIDTGAYMTGRLTALGLEGEESWELVTRGD
jgi:serine/threonine protein phosphatase 1